MDDDPVPRVRNHHHAERDGRGGDKDEEAEEAAVGRGVVHLLVVRLELSEKTLFTLIVSKTLLLCNCLAIKLTNNHSSHFENSFYSYLFYEAENSIETEHDVSNTQVQHEHVLHRAHPARAEQQQDREQVQDDPAHDNSAIDL